MVKKVVKREYKKRAGRKDESIEFVQEYSPSSYKNLLYGAISVVVIIALLFGFFRVLSQSSRKNIADEGLKVSKEQDEIASLNNLNDHQVLKGETLWSISEKVYKDGNMWTELAKANKLENPDLVNEGTKLVIPKIATSNNNAQEVKGTATTSTIDGTEYEIKTGDTLWDICVRAYGDGYRWSEVASVNELENPDLIYPGNKLTLPR